MSGENVVGRVMLGLACAAAVIALYILLLWGFVVWIWPVLPIWAKFIVFLIITVIVMSSPITALRVYGQVRGKPKQPEPQSPPKE